MTRELMAQRIGREMRERALRGESEPGTYSCLRCGRDDCRVFLSVMTPEEADANEGILNRLDRYMHRLPGWDLKEALLCPCCSFPELSGCPHPQKHDCPTCGLPTEPAGSLFGGGPFVRCAFEGVHPEAMPA